MGRGRLIEMLRGAQRLNDQRPIINYRPVSKMQSGSQLSSFIIYRLAGKTTACPWIELQPLYLRLTAPECMWVEPQDVFESYLYQEGIGFARRYP